MAEPGGAEQQVRKWLSEESGYTLEMRTARSFGVGHVQLGRHYVDDTDSTKIRETDVIFRRTERNWDGTAVTISYVIECKDPKVSWVMFESNVRWTRYDDLIKTLIVSDPDFALGLRNIDNFPHIWHQHLVPCYRVEATVSKGEKSTSAYNATQQVLSATRSLAKSDFWPEHNPRHLEIMLPVVVTASPLFVCRLSQADELNVERVDKALLTTEFPPDGSIRSVWIVQADHLDVFGEEARTCRFPEPPLPF